MSAMGMPASRVDAARLGALTSQFDPRAHDFGPVGRQMASLVLEAVQLLLGEKDVPSRSPASRADLDLEQFAPFVRAPGLCARSSDRACAYIRRPLRLTCPDTPLPEIGLLVADATRPFTIWEWVQRRIRWPGSRQPYGLPGASIRLDAAAHLAWLDRRFQIDLLSLLDDFIKANLLVWRDVPHPTMPRSTTLWALAAFALMELHRPTGHGRRVRRRRALADSAAELLLKRVARNGDDGPYDRLLLCEIWLRSQAWSDKLHSQLERHHVLSALQAKFEAGAKRGDASQELNDGTANDENGTEHDLRGVGRTQDFGNQESTPTSPMRVEVTRAQILAVAAEPPLDLPVFIQRLFGALSST